MSLRVYLVCGGLKVLAHDPSFRWSAEGGALLTASTFHWKCYRDLRDTKIQIQYFSFVLGTTFQPTIFPQNSTKTFLLDNMGPPFKQPHVWIPPCLMVILWVLRVGPVCLKRYAQHFSLNQLLSFWLQVCGRATTASPSRLAPLLQPTTRGPPG